LAQTDLHIAVAAPALQLCIIPVQFRCAQAKETEDVANDSFDQNNCLCEECVWLCMIDLSDMLKLWLKLNKGSPAFGKSCKDLLHC